MARRRLTPAQPGYLAETPAPARPEPRSLPPGATPPIAKVSGQSAEAAALRELAEGIETARAEGRMIVDVPLADISAGYLLRDRVGLAREDMDALKASIREHGQRTPAEVTPLAGTEGGAGPAAAGDGQSASGVSPYRFGLISGWRRLRALSELLSETGDMRFSTLRALIRPGRDAGASYVAMVEENEIRVGLSYYERARIVAETTRRGAFADEGTALRSLFATASRAKRSKVGSFITLYDELDDVLRFPADIPERLGLALVARLRSDGVGPVRKALVAAAPETPAAELKLLETLARPAPSRVSRAKQGGEEERIAAGLTLKAARKGQKITLTLSGADVDDRLLEQVCHSLRHMGRG